MLGFAFSLAASDWKLQKQLYNAIKKNDPKEIELILAKDPSMINKQIKYYSFPVLEAARLGSLNAMKILVEKGANINQKESKTGNSALHFAAAKQRQSKEKRENTIEYFVKQKKFQIDIKNKEGVTPFNYAFTSARNPPLLNDGINTIEIFDKYGADLNAKDALGKTVLNYLVSAIFLNRADPAKTSIRGLEIAKCLIEKGADVNLPDKDKRTPLVSFLVHTKTIPEKLKIDFLTVLMENGAKINIKSKKKEKALKLVDKKSKLYKIMKKKYKKKR